jgi:hypothetical protein
MRWLARALLLLAVSATALVSVPVGRLWTPSPLDRDDSAVVADALPRLQFLRRSLDDGTAERMQQLFPEGYLFTNLLYGIAGIDVAERLPSDDPNRANAVRESRRAASAADSTTGRAPFTRSLDPPYGVFYAGWTTWLDAGVLRAEGGPAADPEAAAALHTAVDGIAASVDRSVAGHRPFLQAYPGAAWPVDTVVAIAAVRAADRVLGTDHQGTVDRWTAEAHQHLAPATGLLPHQVDPVTAAPMTGPRATSQVVLLRFLFDIDPTWATASWSTFRRLFASDVPGAPALREFPAGTSGSGDIDSGPLIIGLSASASAVGLGTATVFGDRTVARGLAGLAETTGVPIRLGPTKRYAGGLLPVGDAFLTWSATARPWISGRSPVTDEAWTGAPGWWRLPWMGGATLTLAPLWALTILAAQRRSAAARSDQSGGGPEVPRTISSVGRMRRRGRLSTESSKSSEPATRPFSRNGWRTVVSRASAACCTSS